MIKCFTIGLINLYGIDRRAVQAKITGSEIENLNQQSRSLGPGG